ncbi:hypothetical protein JG687_00014850 [Phytophthora cactorum]|uniref:Uncharacterized protein n=1 Tax=Phytophthora cactorum TaxID=29920 RepID=A0A8T1TVF0_9STRA|nr:hypothetical protein GQ600_24559 [Phytophthora cactorum]KAG6949455.1 hypothetical protein JG687_00014850 [Phytophthora cactorum]
MASCMHSDSRSLTIPSLRARTRVSQRTCFAIDPLQSSRASRNARKVVRALTKYYGSVPQKKRRKREDSLEAVEAKDTEARLARREETKKAECRWPAATTSAEKTPGKTVDGPFLQICGSCGELLKSKQAVLKRYDPRGALYAPLCNETGECEIIFEAVVMDQEGNGSFCHCRMMKLKCLRFVKIKPTSVAKNASVAPWVHRMLLSVLTMIILEMKTITQKHQTQFPTT